jgi:hypothetical protein
MRAQGGVRRGRAGLECESGSGAVRGGEEEGPDKRAPCVNAREGRREGARAAGEPGERLLGRMRERRERRGRGRGGRGPGRKGRKEKEKRKGKWAGPNRDRRGKIKVFFKCF